MESNANHETRTACFRLLNLKQSLCIPFQAGKPANECQ